MIQVFFPIYFIFPDSFSNFYTNPGSDGSSEEPENNKIQQISAFVPI